MKISNLTPHWVGNPNKKGTGHLLHFQAMGKYPQSMHIPNLDSLCNLNFPRINAKIKNGNFKPDRELNWQNYEDAILNNNHSANRIALFVSMPLLKTLITYALDRSSLHTANTIRHYLNHLIIELKHMGSLIHPIRMVTYLHWQCDLPKLLTPAQMTELMFMLDKHFNLAPPNERSFAIELSDTPINESTIALLKGLGFNEVCINANHCSEINVSRLVHPVKLFRNYNFLSVNFRLHINTNAAPTALQNHILELLKLKPDTLYLVDEQGAVSFDNKKSTHKMAKVTAALTSHLKKLGYQKINDVNYSIKKEDINQNFIDIIGMGLGSTSLIDNTFVQNHSQLHQYFDAIQSGYLPIAFGGYVT